MTQPQMTAQQQAVLARAQQGEAYLSDLAFKPTFFRKLAAAGERMPRDEEEAERMLDIARYAVEEDERRRQKQASQDDFLVALHNNIRARDGLPSAAVDRQEAFFLQQADRLAKEASVQAATRDFEAGVRLFA